MSSAVLQTLRQHVLPPRPPQHPQPPPRPPTSAELHALQAQIQASRWDNGVLATFLAESDTRVQAVDTARGYRLLFVASAATAADVAAVAATADALFGWLGMPRGTTLHLWWRNVPRHIGATEWPSKTSVNGGWAVPGDATIVVYRQEEWERVAIHECIHSRKWDWHMPTRPLPCWGFTSADRLQPYLAEAWTELYAEWLVCAWWDVAWSKQCAWQRTQALQVLARAARRGHWEEDTNVFAYYVLKAALSPHIAFLLTCGCSPAEWDYVLCELVTPILAELRSEARTISPVACSMRMSVPPPTQT